MTEPVTITPMSAVVFWSCGHISQHELEDYCRMPRECPRCGDQGLSVVKITERVTINVD